MTPDFASHARIACAAAQQLLGWHPDQFWQATPAELLLALGLDGQSKPRDALDRAGLDRLMEMDCGR